jgi:hypothetical protein
MPNVDFSVLRSLGKTANPKQAGFIDPKGFLVNLSGGDPFGRGIDHQIVGGPQAIKELGAHAGYIRYFPEGNGFEIRKLPTIA